MGRTSHSNYIEAARQVLGELGGGPIASRDLVAAAQERGLVGNGTWVYHNFLRKVRESAEFDTTKRGYVSMFEGAAAVVEEPGTAVLEPVAEVVAPDLTEAALANGPGEIDPVVVEEANPFAETA